MKKTFTFFLCMLLLAACSQSEVVESKDNNPHNHLNRFHRISVKEAESRLRSFMSKSGAKYSSSNDIDTVF